MTTVMSTIKLFRVLLVVVAASATVHAAIRTVPSVRHRLPAMTSSNSEASDEDFVVPDYYYNRPSRHHRHHNINNSDEEESHVVPVMARPSRHKHTAAATMRSHSLGSRPIALQPVTTPSTAAGHPTTRPTDHAQPADAAGPAHESRRASNSPDGRTMSAVDALLSLNPYNGHISASSQQQRPCPELSTLSTSAMIRKLGIRVESMVVSHQVCIVDGKKSQPYVQPDISIRLVCIPLQMTYVPMVFRGAKRFTFVGVVSSYKCYHWYR